MSKSNPLKAAAEKLADALGDDGPAEGIPGAPSLEPVPVEEPVKPRGPLPPKPDQGTPETVVPRASRPAQSPPVKRRAVPT